MLESKIYLTFVFVVVTDQRFGGGHSFFTRTIKLYYKTRRRFRNDRKKKKKNNFFQRVDDPLRDLKSEICPGLAVEIPYAEYVARTRCPTIAENNRIFSISESVRLRLFRSERKKEKKNLKKCDLSKQNSFLSLRWQMRSEKQVKQFTHR